MNKCLSAGDGGNPADGDRRCQQPTGQQLMRTTPIRRSISARSPATSAGGSGYSSFDQGPELRVPDQGRRLAGL